MSIIFFNGNLSRDRKKLVFFFFFPFHVLFQSAKTYEWAAFKICCWFFIRSSGFSLSSQARFYAVGKLCIDINWMCKFRRNKENDSRHWKRLLLYTALFDCELQFVLLLLKFTAVNPNISLIYIYNEFVYRMHTTSPRHFATVTHFPRTHTERDRHTALVCMPYN